MWDHKKPFLNILGSAITFLLDFWLRFTDSGKTKIICTIGPASAGEEILTQMCRFGMNVARLNFSHGSHEEHLEKIKMIKKVREKLGYPLPIMLDTKDPEYRIRNFKNRKEILQDGQTFTFTTRDVSGYPLMIAERCQKYFIQ